MNTADMAAIGSMVDRNVEALRRRDAAKPNPWTLCSGGSPIEIYDVVVTIDESDMDAPPQDLAGFTSPGKPWRISITETVKFTGCRETFEGNI